MYILIQRVSILVEVVLPTLPMLYLPFNVCHSISATFIGMLFVCPDRERCNLKRVIENKINEIFEEMRNQESIH